MAGNAQSQNILFTQKILYVGQDWQCYGKCTITVSDITTVLRGNVEALSYCWGDTHGKTLLEYTYCFLASKQKNIKPVRGIQMLQLRLHDENDANDGMMSIGIGRSQASVSDGEHRNLGSPISRILTKNIFSLSLLTLAHIRAGHNRIKTRSVAYGVCGPKTERTALFSSTKLPCLYYKKSKKIRQK